MKRVLPLLLALGAPIACAQSTSDVANGTSFAHSIAPTSPSQIVNPSGVGSAWSGSTSTPTTVPSGFAGFSNPNTSSAALTSARSGSLGALGDQAQVNCASYAPGSDPYQNQYCAAVNFLNDQCMRPTAGETSVLGKTGTTQGTSANCAGTYGAGQSQFNYGNQVTSSDPMFQLTGNLVNTATGTLTQTCSTQTVITQPAQYATNSCIVSTDEESNSCSQYLSATIVNTTSGASSSQSCTSGGSLQNGTCVNQTTYPPQLTCPAGYVMTGNWTCLQTSTIGAGPPSCPSGWLSVVEKDPAGVLLCEMPGSYPGGCPNSEDGMPLELSYLYTCWYMPPPSCPSGYTWNGSVCTKTVTVGSTYTCPSGGSLQGQSCVTTTTSAPTVTYSCPPGQTLNGTSCIRKSVTTTWTDACSTYEKSAGVSLPTPTH